MGTGFTWDTQDRQADIDAAQRTWHEAYRMLTDPNYDLVILDELTYMLAFGYLSESKVISTVDGRPQHQSVVITGRGGGAALQDLADTVSEVKDIKHAFNAGVKARKGVDY
jgi:cob(I)alamin adenosyltransferase